MYIKVPWTTMELARRFTSFSCQLQVWSASVSHYTMLRLLTSDLQSSIFNLQWCRPEKASAVLGVCVTCIVGACGSVSVYLQHCDL